VITPADEFLTVRIRNRGTIRTPIQPMLPRRCLPVGYYIIFY
jgi:hypothetical protein